MEKKPIPSSAHLPDSVRAIIDLWPNRRTCAIDVGVSKARVDKWAQTGSVPARYHRRLISSAQERGFRAITADLLADLHALPLIKDAA